MSKDLKERGDDRLHKLAFWYLKNLNLLEITNSKDLCKRKGIYFCVSWIY